MSRALVEDSIKNGTQTMAASFRTLAEQKEIEEKNNNTNSQHKN